MPSNMDATYFINKYKNNIISVAVIIAALIVANNIYQGQASAVAALKAQKGVETKKNELLSSISQLEAKFGKYKKLLNSKTSSAVINTLNTIAKDTKVTITSLKPGEEKKVAFYTRYPFTLSVKTANYHLLGDFISKLESSPDVYTVELLSIAKQATDETSGVMLTAQIELSTIVLQDK